MRRFKRIIVFVLLFVPIILVGQTFDLNLKATMLRNNGAWKEGEQVNIVKFVHEACGDEVSVDLSVKSDNSSRIKNSFYLEDDIGNKVEITSKIDDCFEFEFENVQQLWDSKIITNVLYSLKKKGLQYDLRREMENDALDYLQQINNYGLIFNDPYLETYIYSLVAKIAPTQFIDGRPGSINIVIHNNPTINAGCYPNGTIVINTGLLAVLHSEDELVAILAHEIAHFVLDHSIQNVNAAISRQKRAEFWAGLATGLMAVAEGYVASQNVYYVPGGATLGMAMLTASISSQVIDHLGMKYNHEQEMEADLLAIQVLKILGYDENALATALSRIKDESIKERNDAIYIDSYTHPSLVERINNVGVPSQIRDVNFERAISFAISDVALMKYENRRFHQCIPYVAQNIENNVATADDYILMANCLLSTKDDSVSNMEVVELINRAKLLDEYNINIFKSEIIVTLRLGDLTKAQVLLQQYIETLDQYSIDNIKNDNTWKELYDFISKEKNWANKMVIKLNGMKSL